MKNVILFIVLLCISSTSFGQGVTLFAAEIDSLNNLLHATIKDDTIKVKRLNDLAGIYFYDLQYRKAAFVAKQAQQIAIKLNYLKGEGMYLRTMSCTFMDTYYGTKARLFYKDLNKTEPVNTIKDKEADSIYFENGLIRLQEDLAFFEKQKDKEMIANTFYALSATSGYLNKSEDELVYIDKAIIAFKGIDMEDAVAFLLIRKMTALQRAHKTGETEEIGKEVNPIINALHDKRISAFLTYQLCQFYNLNIAGKRALTIEKELKANNDLEVNEDKQLQILILEDLGVNFAYLSMPNKAVEYYKKAIQLREELNYYNDVTRIYFNLGFELVATKDLEGANKYFLKAKTSAENTGDSNIIAWTRFRYLDGMGQILMAREKYPEALKTFYQADDLYKKRTSQSNFYMDFYIAACYQKTGDLKKSIYYGEQSYITAASDYDQRLLTKICLLLSEVYEQSGAAMKSYEYLKKYRNLVKEKEKQDIGNQAAGFEIQAIIEKNQAVKDRLEKDKLQKEKENQNQKWWIISIAGALLSAFVVLFVLFRNNKQKQKANVLLQRQKQEIDNQRDKVEKAYTDLKATQSQLVQSEKMASLGELTAGIAHEIQNPLNFVNNFSEVNQELISELVDEVEKGNIKEVKAIAKDIKENEQKINHHGKRADAIVKGMLQHSRKDTGVKEPTDINALADEYLRLSFHGIRAKDKTFNANINTNFDESIGKINIVSQDIGRVLLNLFNNAFYAVNDKKKTAGENYKPLISIQTKKINDKIEIIVKDSGNGIPQNIVDKIFQPFFTTKPTGQGTGLGLSLSYDIIKVHGGEMKVESEEGKFAKFIILLPV